MREMNLDGGFSRSHRLGLDVGSTTAKLVALDAQGRLCFSSYRRHGANLEQVLPGMFEEAAARLGDVPVRSAVTGSAGMGIAETREVSFVQEVNATIDVVRGFFPGVSTLIDIGGEDSKMVFFSGRRPPDIRMNGNCAGGTGAFIDQMAGLLGVSLECMDALAGGARRIHPIASRCGVFAKTDVQNLLSRKVDPAEICASILHAVVLQNLATLARGAAVRGPVILAGGPLTFLGSLRLALRRVLGLDEDDILLPAHSQYLPAWGAALNCPSSGPEDSLAGLCARICGPTSRITAVPRPRRLAALFEDDAEYRDWEVRRTVADIPAIPPSEARMPLFLGIDSGSTTTKLFAVDDAGRMVFGSYGPNAGQPLEAVGSALRDLRSAFAGGPKPRIAEIGVTGYGEDLICAALDLDVGVVETVAHWRGALRFNENVSTILDIGGQDMKAIFLAGGGIRRIEINEACSSGCGSFIEGFAQTLGLDVGTFAARACRSREPFDLGTRCTVFMNSRIKQAQRENASIEDIAAGLAYSVVKNALYKLLKLRDPKQLGDHVVVQGGAFRNLAVVRALELLVGRAVSSSHRPELMGAYGAALLAKERWESFGRERGLDIDQLCAEKRSTTRTIHCKGCTNRCQVAEFAFQGGNRYFAGNKCERVFCNRGRNGTRGENVFTLRNKVMFECA